jgi:hypothetical protein
MKWLVLIVAVMVTLFALVYLIGLTRPTKHVARGRAMLQQSPQEVWDVLADFSKWPDWNSEIQRVEPRPESNGHPAWAITGRWGEMPTEVTASEPPRRLQTLVDAGSFRGWWTYEIEAADGGAQLTITEEGEVDNAFFRGLMILHDEHATMKSFVRALSRRLGREVELEELP